MDKSESIAKLMPALIEAGKNMGVVAKSEKNKHYGYNYASLEDYLNVASRALATNALCVVTSNPTAIQLEDRGKEHTVQVELTMTLLHSSGEWIKIGVCGQAQDVGDKAVYQAITGARKYGLACLFNLVTSDDPERTGKKQEQKRQTAPQETQPQTKPKTDQPQIQSVKELDRLVESLQKCKSVEETEGWKKKHHKEVKALLDNLQQDFYDIAKRFKTKLPERL